MYKIIGNVTTKETGYPVPNLKILFVNSDSDSSAAGREFNIEKIKGDRVGSVSTGLDGRFEFSFDEADLRARTLWAWLPWTSKVRHLLLAVLAPEAPGRSENSRLLYVSSSIRPGKQESHFIQLSEDQLKAAGVPVPTQRVQEPENIVKKVAEEYEAHTKVQQGIKAIRAEAVNTKRVEAQQYREQFEAPLVKALSKKPPFLVHPERHVEPGESVTEKSMALIKDNIENVVNNSEARPPVRGHIALTPGQSQRLFNGAATDGNGNYLIPAEDIEPILRQNQNGMQPSPVLLRDDPIAKFCREKTAGEKHLDEEENGEDGTNADTTNGQLTGNNVVALTGEDIPAYVARLTDNMASPENPVIFGIPPDWQRPDQQAIQDNIDAFLLRKGPAENPAFYDFHNLQIAFDHVWQEAIDEGVLDLAKYAYDQIVELGGSPDMLANAPGDPVKAMKQEAALVFKAQASGQASAQTSGNTAGVRLMARRRDPIEDIDNPLRDYFPPGPIIPPFRPPVPIPPAPAPEPVPGGTDSSPWNYLHAILQALAARLKESYSFTAFGAKGGERSVNFGILVTYRQKWDPIAYQAGELAKTITLAPKEVRKFSTKTVIKKKRAEKEVDSSLRSRKEESSQTSRAEAEIMRKAVGKTNFNLTAEGTFDIKIADGTATTAFTRDAETTSQQMKKEFREAVFKAAQEYKQERKVEVSTEESFETETTESGEISNPNDELAVTCLFYELQRRFKVSERIHRLTPVVLVAQEIPRPEEIDEDWLIAHDWILNRVLLDDSFRPALTYLSAKIVGDEFALKELQKNIEQQRGIVDAIKKELLAAESTVARIRNILEWSIYQQASKVNADDAGDSGFSLSDLSKIPLVGNIYDSATEIYGTVGNVIGAVGDWLFPHTEDKLNAEERLQATRDAANRAENTARETRSRLDRELSKLNSITEAYAKALSEHLNRRVQIARLQLHIKDNILHYMQAKWAHESPDLRYMRMLSTQVPVLEGPRTYVVNPTPADTAECNLPGLAPEEMTCHEFSVTTDMNSDLQYKTLEEVADLDNLLGFKGNYMIFPLKESNALTDFMMAPYVDSAFGLHDPDEFGDMTLDEFSDYVCCLKEELGEDFNDDVKDRLKAYLKKLLTSPLRNNEEIIVPTGSLFIEVLPGAHPILEDFKLMHRAIDVKKVQAEVREMELENLRAAARIVTDNFEDPDIEKKILIAGNGQSVVLPEGE